MRLLTRWLWARRSLTARAARLVLLPPSLMYRAIMAFRARVYTQHLMPQAIPSAPTVAVGNLTVGGSGKTPIAAWIAQYYAGRGLTPGVVLRGYGGDEAVVHRGLVPGAIVVEHADRIRAARQAVAEGADVVVLDDAFQRIDVARDLNVAVVSAESTRASPHTLPAGPWREGWRALRRADLVVVTRKQAPFDVAKQVALRVRKTVPGAGLAIARLGIGGFRRLVSGDAVGLTALAGARVIASAGIGDPDSFAAQCRALGARVRLVPWPDHHRFTPRDVAHLLQSSSGVDYVVVTQKDAAKLKAHWPGDAPEPLVAGLDVAWEYGAETVESALDVAAADVDELLTDSTSP
ncbi:MAG: tetraacyldisaccharide 4'-kinase [Gemmatimonadales bacterium]|jgi:tetraacyldisaccharide 4'-kinase